MTNELKEKALSWDDAFKHPVSDEKLLQIQETLLAFFKTLDEWDRKRDRA